MRNVMLLLLGAAACQPAESAVREDAVRVLDTAEAAAGIDSLEARFLAAYDRDDAQAIAETYTQDVRFIQDGTVEQGRALMEKGWKAEVGNLSDLKLTTIERTVREDVGVLTQRFAQQYRTPEGKTVTDSGYFVGMVRRDPDGRWRYHTVVLSRPPVHR